METFLLSPANASVFGISTVVFSVLIPLIGISIFAYIIARRLVPLIKAQPCSRFDHIKERIVDTFNYPHHRMPRYKVSAVIHMSFLFSFIILFMRWIALVLIGFYDGFIPSGSGGLLVNVSGGIVSIVETYLFLVCIFVIIRRGFIKPEIFAVPSRYGKDHAGETIFGILVVSSILLADMFFTGSFVARGLEAGLETRTTIPGTGTWIVATLFHSVPLQKLQAIYLSAYYAHSLLLFFFLCLLPFGRFFHLITAIPNLLAMKRDKGAIKPVVWGVEEDEIAELESFGVKKLEDFTWKNILDFYTCADCGRCSDQCPANAVGRPLSPRFITMKGREHVFKRYPVIGSSPESEPLIGSVYDEEEIWSCTTCGACEAECPIMIEYIDKIVDLRRGMVDEGNVPQSLQKPLRALEKRGNPYGIMGKKRADWIKAEGFEDTCHVKLIDKEPADTLYFVDSITSHDDQMQEIARATARVLTAIGVDFGILGSLEKDSGHEVKRFGEEMLFQYLKDVNTTAIIKSGAKRIVTTDPHAYNALKNDYNGIPPVEHICQLIAETIGEKKIRLKEIEDKEAVYTYHDPCYMGRHNAIYDIPRQLIDAIPGIRRVEMSASKNRSFCCGGGGLMLFCEVEEEKRMGQVRVDMAKEAGANIIVTSCPFCIVNLDDGIKTSGLEGKMKVIDIVELIDRHLIKDR